MIRFKPRRKFDIHSYLNKRNWEIDEINTGGDVRSYRKGNCEIHITQREKPPSDSIHKERVVIIVAGKTMCDIKFIPKSHLITEYLINQSINQ